MKILVVEDTEDARILLEDQLTVEEYEVVSAINGIEGLEKAKLSPPDLIISDILMPKMDGFEFCRQLKKDAQLKLIPFIFYTATYTDSRDEELAMSLGASRFVIKPQDPVALIEIIKDVMSRAGEMNHEPSLNNHSLDQLHSDALTRKLEKKIQQLDAQKEHLRLITDALPVVIAEVDKEYRYLYVNKTFEDWFQLSRDEITGKRMDEIIGDELFRAIKPHADIALQGEAVSFEDHVTLPDTIERDLFVRYVPSFDDDESVRGFVALVSDISERKKSEKEKELLGKQLNQSQKMNALGKLTGGIAHDYNNMLGIVTGYAELLEDALSDQPQLAKYAHEIHHAGERGAKLTKKLLAFSRHKASEADRLNLNTLLQSEQHMLEKILTARIALILDLAQELWPVMLDGSDLEDAILNMSINAMHAMETGGQLTIQTCNTHLDETNARILQVEAGDYVLLSITDSGSGMDDATKEKVFEPFYTTKGDKGTGLGLSQVYGFVERSGGAIKVYSEQGHGTRMNLYFPRHYESGSDDKPEADENAVNFDGNETILVVDDESALLDLTCEILIQHGFNVIPAENAKKALDILENESIDLLISDIIMPEMDGYELASIVQEKYPTVKIQLASGFSSAPNLDMINKSLHQNLLLKPFNSQILLQRIRELFNEK